MTNPNTKTSKLRKTLAPVAGNAAGAVVDPKSGAKRLKSAVSSPKPLAVAAALGAAYALGRRHGHRAGR